MISLRTFKRWRMAVDSYFMRRGNPLLDRLVFDYLFQRCDDESGVVGANIKVSHAGIAGDLSEKGGQGKRKELIVFSRDDVRNAIRRLVESGLLERLSLEKGDDLELRFIFEAENLEMSFSVQNEVTLKLPTSYHDKVEVNQGTYDGHKTGSRGEVTTTPSTTTTTDSRFLMNLDWKPSDLFWKRVELAGLKREQVFGGWVGEFVSYRSSNDGTRRTQAQWEHKLLENVIGYIRNPNLGKSAKIINIANQPTRQQKARQGIVMPNLFDATALQNWAVKNGFRAANYGESSEQYRAAIHAAVTTKNLAMSKEVKRE